MSNTINSGVFRITVASSFTYIGKASNLEASIANARTALNAGRFSNAALQQAYDLTDRNSNSLEILVLFRANMEQAQNIQRQLMEYVEVCPSLVLMNERRAKAPHSKRTDGRRTGSTVPRTVSSEGRNVEKKKRCQVLFTDGSSRTFDSQAAAAKALDWPQQYISMLLNERGSVPSLPENVTRICRVA